MKICDYLRTEFIFLDAELSDRESVLQFVADICVKHGVANDATLIYDGLLDREQTMSTGVGKGVAFPHTTCIEIKEAAVFLIRLIEPIDFNSLDNFPVDTVVSLVIPADKTTLHLRLLARISRLYKKPAFIKAVRVADNSNRLWEDIKRLEEASPFFSH